MFVHRVAPILTLLLALSAEPAWAFLDPPYITPASPTVGDAISVSIYGGECDLVDDGVVWPPPVTQEGNEITILFRGIHEGDPEFCHFGIGTATFPVGRYTTGSYTLHADWQYFNFAGTLVQETLGVVPFNVTGVTPLPPELVPAPALGIPALSILLLVLISLAAWCLHSRRT